MYLVYITIYADPLHYKLCYNKTFNAIIMLQAQASLINAIVAMQ